MTRISGYGTGEKSGNKFHAVRTYSEICKREFASKSEARRGEELALLERAGGISKLEYQPKFVLYNKPRITYTADFRYTIKTDWYNNLSETVVEDVKGVLARETRVKLAWLQEKTGITVRLVTKEELR